jgi:hypothetical protein
VVAVIMLCPSCEAWQLDLPATVGWALGPTVAGELVVDELRAHMRACTGLCCRAGGPCVGCPDHDAQTARVEALHATRVGWPPGSVHREKRES